MIFGEIFQFDAATGPDSFLASVDGDQQNGDFVFYEHNALLVGQSARQLEDVVQGDLIAAWVTGTGELSYETQIGGETTVPTFVINRIKVTGSAS